MQFDSRKSGVARIGRSYPRFAPSSGASPAPRRQRCYGITAAVVALFSLLGVIAWLRVR